MEQVVEEELDLAVDKSVLEHFTVVDENGIRRCKDCDVQVHTGEQVGLGLLLLVLLVLVLLLLLLLCPWKHVREYSTVKETDR